MCTSALPARSPGPAQCLAVDGHHLASGQPGNRANPGYKALFQLLGDQGRKDPVESVMRRNPARQAQKTVQPFPLRLAIVLDLVPAVGAAQNRRNRDQKNLFQKMFPRALHTRILQLRRILQGILHVPIPTSTPALHIAIKMRLPGLLRSPRRSTAKRSLFLTARSISCSNGVRTSWVSTLRLIVPSSPIINASINALILRAGMPFAPD